MQSIEIGRFIIPLLLAALFLATVRSHRMASVCTRRRKSISVALSGIERNARVRNYSDAQGQLLRSCNLFLSVNNQDNPDVGVDPL